MASEKQTSEFEAACSAMATFTAVTRQADAKIAILAALYGASLALAAVRVETVGAAYERGDVAIVTCAAVLLVGLLGTAYQLLLAMRPRIRQPAGFNRFSLLPGRTTVRPSWTDRQGATEAWRLAEILSEIAVRKLRRIGRAVCWTAVYVCGFLGLLVAEALGNA